MMDIVAAVQDITSYGSLPEGWHFGGGKPSSATTRMQAIIMAGLVAQTISSSLDDIETFPGIDGEIQVNFYKDEASLEVVFEIDATITVTLDMMDKSMRLGTKLSLDKAIKILKEFAFDKCLSSASLISQSTTVANVRGLQVSRSVPQAMVVAFPSSADFAARKEAVASAYMSQRTMRQPLERQSYFGKSQTNESQQGAELCIA